MKNISPDNLVRMADPQPYYIKQNESFLKEHPDSPYTFTKETLGFRLDSKEEMAAFRCNELPTQKIGNFSEYVKALVKTMLESQNNTHLHSDDWQRTIYIDTLGISTTDFDLVDEKKKELVDSGKKGALNYFDWFDKSPEKIINRP